MKRTDAFKSNYLGQGDLERPTLAVIEEVGIESLNGDNGKEEKPVAHFKGDIKPFIINQTNWQVLEDAYGDDSDAWIGKRVELYVDKNIMFGAKRVGGVRVRIPAAGANGSAKPTDALAAKRAAWNGFKLKYPDATPDDLAALWKEVVENSFPKPVEQITGPEWTAFLQSGFESGDPVGDDQVPADVDGPPF